jgi:deoxyribose-phosphate aldolase
VTLHELLRCIRDETREILASGGSDRVDSLQLPEFAPLLSAALDARTAHGAPGMLPDEEKILRGTLESTCLSPVAGSRELDKFVRESVRAGCRAVCVLPCHVGRVKKLLEGHETLLVTVAAFPLGGSDTAVKIHETSRAVSQGSDEVDFVANLSWLKEGNLIPFSDEIVRVKEAAGPGKRVKVILETGLLSDAELVRGAIVASLAGSDFVKTSTGFGPRGVNPRDVALLAEVLGSRTGIKASGGVRTREQARELIARGASRIGTSSALSILRAPAADMSHE